MRDGNEIELGERPHYFELRLQKSAIDFYRTLTDAQKGSYDETLKASRTKKPLVFWGQLARLIQYPENK